jgi:HEAT repeat protein
MRERSNECQRGPVRVVMHRAGGGIVDLEVFAGPLAAAEAGVRDLGTVGAREASSYLLSLARELDGKPGREAILPAVLADSSAPAAALLALARDTDRPRDTRRSAISYLAREANAGASEVGSVVSALSAMARDANDVRTVRTAALSTLARFDGGAGVPTLIELSASSGDPWLARGALDALARSGDPRARTALREAIPRAGLDEDARVSAIRGLAREYATGSDLDFLRNQFRSLDGEKSRMAIMSAMAEVGGRENADWLLSLAGDGELPRALRRRALTSAERAGVSASAIASLYDRLEERQMREAAISALAQSGTRDATDKLLAIARTDTDYQIRRRAISQLSRSDDPRVTEALKAIARP